MNLQGHVVALVNVVNVVGHAGAGTIGIHLLENPPVKVIVAVLDGAAGRAREIIRVGRVGADLGQPVAVVPGVLGNIRVAGIQYAVRADEPERAVAFAVIEIMVGAVGRELVPRAGRVAGASAVAVGVVGVALVALAAVIDARELVGGVVR